MAGWRGRRGDEAAPPPEVPNDWSVWAPPNPPTAGGDPWTPSSPPTAGGGTWNPAEPPAPPPQDDDWIVPEAPWAADGWVERQGISTVDDPHAGGRTQGPAGALHPARLPGDGTWAPWSDGDWLPPAAGSTTSAPGGGWLPAAPAHRRRVVPILLVGAIALVLAGAAIALVNSRDDGGHALTPEEVGAALLRPADIGPGAAIDVEERGVLAGFIDDYVWDVEAPDPDDPGRTSPACLRYLADQQRASVHPFLALVSAGAGSTTPGAQEFFLDGRSQVTHHLAADEGQLGIIADVLAACEEIVFDDETPAGTMELSEGPSVGLSVDHVTVSMTLRYDVDPRVPVAEEDRQLFELMDGATLEVAFATWAREGIVSQVSLFQFPESFSPGMDVRVDQERLRELVAVADAKLVDVLDGAG